LNISNNKNVNGVAQTNAGQNTISAYSNKITNVIVAKHQGDKPLNNVIMALLTVYLLPFLIYSFFSSKFPSWVR
jgi:hypothetical protein